MTKKTVDADLSGAPPETMQYTKEQVAIAHSAANCLLVRALAGTGKTETIAYRVETQLAHGVLPGDMLLLSFTRSGRDALDARIKSKGIKGVKVRTMDSFAVEQYMKIYGHKPRVVDGERLMEHALNATDSFKYFTPQEMKRLSAWAQNESHVDVVEGFQEVVTSVLERYEHYKVSTGVMDFDDLMRAVAEVTVGGFKEVILDEAQDMKQWHQKFVMALTEQRSVFVGDPYQSVYGFAGITPQALDRVGGEVLTLTKSFRSQKNLLRLPNSLFNLELVSDLRGGSVNFTQDIKQSPVDVAAHVLKTKPDVILTRTRYEGEQIARALEKHGKTVARSGEKGTHKQFKVSTVHAAKGLEWDRILIVGIGSEGWRRALVNTEEEKRLFYVATTRACKRVDIYYFDGLPWGISHEH